MPVIKYIPPMPSAPPQPKLVQGRVYRLVSGSVYFVYHAESNHIIYLANEQELIGGWDRANALVGKSFVEVTLEEV